MSRPYVRFPPIPAISSDEPGRGVEQKFKGFDLGQRRTRLGAEVLRTHSSVCFRTMAREDHFQLTERLLTKAHGDPIQCP